VGEILETRTFTHNYVLHIGNHNWYVFTMTDTCKKIEERIGYIEKMVEVIDETTLVISDMTERLSALYEYEFNERKAAQLLDIIENLDVANSKIVEALPPIYDNLKKLLGEMLRR